MFPALPRLMWPRASVSIDGKGGALGTKAFSLKRGSTQHGAAGNPRICLFNCLRTATTSRHLNTWGPTCIIIWIFLIQNQSCHIVQQHNITHLLINLCICHNCAFTTSLTRHSISLSSVSSTKLLHTSSVHRATHAAFSFSASLYVTWTNFTQRKVEYMAKILWTPGHYIHIWTWWML